jgi:hypothetical protein
MHGLGQEWRKTWVFWKSNRFQVPLFQLFPQTPCTFGVGSLFLPFPRSHKDREREELVEGFWKRAKKWNLEPSEVD